MSELAAWDSFYVIVGSAAGALIGLQFVVVTLIAQRPTRAAPEASAAFGTPTIVHFSAALLLSALVRAPWQATAVPVILWAALGLCGAIYSLNVIRRMRGSIAVAVHRHPQRLGRRFLSCVFQQARHERRWTLSAAKAAAHRLGASEDGATACLYAARCQRSYRFGFRIAAPLCSRDGCSLCSSRL
jgi:hypothetical protein